MAFVKKILAMFRRKKPIDPLPKWRAEREKKAARDLKKWGESVEQQAYERGELKL